MVAAVVVAAVVGGVGKVFGAVVDGGIKFI